MKGIEALDLSTRWEFKKESRKGEDVLADLPSWTDELALHASIKDDEYLELIFRRARPSLKIKW